MEIIKNAVAGTMESSDCQITIGPSEDGIHIDLDSNVKALFGKSIEHTIRDVLAEMDVENAEITVIDKGAMDCVIRARMQCVVCRGADTSFDWSKEKACYV